MTELIDRFVAWYFVPPKPPPINVGWAGRVVGVERAFADFGRFCYSEGAKDGAMCGALAVLVLLAVVYVACHVLRGGPVKGVLNAVQRVA